MRINRLVLILVATLLPAVALAQPQPQPEADLIPPSRGGQQALRIMARLDPDMDRAIRIDEIRKPETFAGTLLTLMDLNNDRQLDLVEFQRGGGAKRLAWFRKVDTNQNGRLSLSEIEAATAKPVAARLALRALDDNGDGKLSFAELRLGFPEARSRERLIPPQPGRTIETRPPQLCWVPIAPEDSSLFLFVPVTGGACGLW